MNYAEIKKYLGYFGATGIENRNSIQYNITNNTISRSLLMKRYSYNKDTNSFIIYDSLRLNWTELVQLYLCSYVFVVFVNPKGHLSIYHQFDS